MSAKKSHLIILGITDSTNNYAMRLINDDLATHGTAIVAAGQTHGKGQRGRTWADVPGESLLMSVVVTPSYALSQQFLYTASIAFAIANVLQNLFPSIKFQVKWPNDLIIHDKKAGGILIENIIRGNKWTFSVIGLGLNVFQSGFPESLPHATSLKMAAGVVPEMDLIRDELWSAICNAALYPRAANAIMDQYNGILYKKGEWQQFSAGGETWQALLLQVRPDGLLEVQLANGEIKTYEHGSVTWEYGH